MWSPLASGLLTGKYDDGIPPDSRLARMEWLREGLYVDEKVNKVRAMKNLADSLGTTRTRLALAWAARHPNVSSVILGATRLEQLHDNLAGLDLEIPDEIYGELNKLFQ